MENDVPSFSLVSRLRRTLWAMLLLPVAAGLAFFLFYSRQALQESAVRDLAAMLSLERQYIDVWVAERTADIRMLAADQRVLRLPPGERREVLRAVLHGSAGFDDVVFADARGRTVSDPIYPSGVDIADREYFRQPRDTGGTYLSDVLVSRRSGRRTIMISAPVLDEQGAFRGVVFGAMDLATITTLVETLQNESSGRTFLVQANGAVVSPIGQSPNLKPGDVIFDRARAGADLNGAYVNAEGRRVVGTYQWVNGGRWLLVAEKPELEILAVHAGALGAPLVGAGLVFLILGPAALRLTRSLREPMRRLEAHAQSIQAGDYGMDCDPAPKPGEPVEVQRLNRAYCLMVDRVRGTLEDLRQASLTDPLTGAANRKRLFSEGPRLVEAARRAGQPVSALMLDLDRFKAVNDTYGHAAGDVVLQVFARRLQGMLRQSDLFVRYGGEEFVVLAPNAGGAAARELAERVRAAIEGVRVDADGTELRFTVSVGASSLPPTDAKGPPRPPWRRCSPARTRRFTWPRPPDATGWSFCPCPRLRREGTATGLVDGRALERRRGAVFRGLAQAHHLGAEALLARLAGRTALGDDHALLVQGRGVDAGPGEDARGVAGAPKHRQSALGALHIQKLRVEMSRGHGNLPAVLAG